LYVDRWGQTNAGKQRPDNQDTIYFAQAGKQEITQAQIDMHGVLLAVADGVGGEYGGHAASEAIVRHLVAAYYNAPTADPIYNLRQAIQQADFLARQEITYREAATTLVAAVIWKDMLYVANIGDSRAYWIRGEQIYQLTEDHVQNGKLARYLVSYPNVQPDIVQLPELAVGDRILLCSDGLYDPIPETSEIRVLATRGGAKRAVSRLVKTANRYGGPDNISVVLARLAERPAAAIWQIGLIAGLLMLLGIIGFSLVTTIWLEPNGVNMPTLMPTAAVPMTTMPPTPIMTATLMQIDEVNTTEMPSNLHPTVTQQPSRTPTLAPSATPISPTPTNTPTATSTNTLTPTSTATTSATLTPDAPSPTDTPPIQTPAPEF
jgi:PPM family protein phosphatase